jgi:hypothetical protein
LIQEYCAERKVVLAMVYDTGFYGEAALPGDWEKAGTLQIPHNYVCGSDTVSFYAVQPGTIEKLRENLRDFARTALFGTRVQIQGKDPPPGGF